MLCARCQKNEASFLFQKIVDGVVLESGLCAGCRDEETLGVWIGDSPLGTLLSSLGAPVQKRKRLQCSGCGLGYAEFRRRGRLGCPDCYASFEPAMAEVLSEVHGCAKHGGKRPPPRDPDALRKAIAAAVAAEDFESAARLRDRLKRLENR